MAAPITELQSQAEVGGAPSSPATIAQISPTTICEKWGYGFPSENLPETIEVSTLSEEFEVDSQVLGKQSIKMFGTTGNYENVDDETLKRLSALFS